MNIQKNENIIKEQIVIYLNTILDCHTSKSVKFWNLVLYITHPITAAAAAVLQPVWRRHLLRSTHRQQDLGSETEKHEIDLKGKWVERGILDTGSKRVKEKCDLGGRKEKESWRWIEEENYTRKVGYECDYFYFGLAERKLKMKKNGVSFFLQEFDFIPRTPLLLLQWNSLFLVICFFSFLVEMSVNVNPVIPQVGEIFNQNLVNVYCEQSKK